MPGFDPATGILKSVHHQHLKRYLAQMGRYALRTASPPTITRTQRRPAPGNPDRALNLSGISPNSSLLPHRQRQLHLDGASGGIWFQQMVRLRESPHRGLRGTDKPGRRSRPHRELLVPLKRRWAIERCRHDPQRQDQNFEPRFPLASTAQSLKPTPTRTSKSTPPLITGRAGKSMKVVRRLRLKLKPVSR